MNCPGRIVSLITAATLMTVISGANALGSQDGVKADPTKGQGIYNAGDPSRGIPACASCHGSIGSQLPGPAPALAAQLESYLTKQLRDFRGSQRSNSIMSPVAATLTDADMADVAGYLSVQAAISRPDSSENPARRGKQIYLSGITEKNVPACANCHGPDGGGRPGPRVAGQKQQYIAAQLSAFRSGSRKNGPLMVPIVTAMSDEDINAAANYIAGLK